MAGSETQINMIENAVSLLKDVSPYLMTFITAILVLWAIFRARSAHFLLDKIWRLIGGGVINDPDLKKDWLQIRDLEGFRFRTGIKFNSKATWRQTLLWLEQNDKNLNDLAFAKAWIEDKPWNFKEPWLRCINTFVLIVFLTVLPLVMGMTFIFTEPSALLTIKRSQVTFWTDGVNAKNFEWASKTPKFAVDSAACNNNAVIAGLENKDKDIICSSLEISSMPKIKHAVIEQKILSAYIAVILIIALTLVARFAARAKMAKAFFNLPSPHIV